jgi:HK97 family phage prohead protease
MTMKFEIRSTPKGKTVSGYAARYGVLSGNLGGFRERIMRGAFDAVLRTKPDVVALYNHNPNQVLGRTGAGTLRLNADSNGLAFDCDLPNTTYAKDLTENLERGNLNGCSFAFQAGPDDAEFGEEQVEEEGRGLVKSIVRTLRGFRSLLDVSIVTYPAYPGTSVALRGLDADRGAHRHYEMPSTSKPFITAKELEARIAEHEFSMNEVVEMRKRRRRLIEQALY